MSTYLDPHNPGPLRYDDCPPLLKQYIEHKLSISNLMRSTVNAYYVDVHQFLRFYAVRKGYVPEEKDLSNVKVKKLTDDQICEATKNDVLAYLYYSANDKRNSPRTRKKQLTSITSFFNFLLAQEKIESNPTQFIEAPSLKAEKNALPKYLTLPQSQALLRTTSKEFQSRDYCIIALMLNTGVRKSELTGINLKDISEDRKSIKIRGKGGKERIIYINDQVVQALDTYLEERGKIEDLIDENALFVTKRRRKRITGKQVQNIIKSHVEAAGLTYTGCTPHRLRHTFATAMLQSGAANLEEVSKLLGHGQIGTTQIYAKVSNDKLAKISEDSPFKNLMDNK